MIFLFLSFQFRAAVKKYAFLLVMPHGPLALVALRLPHLSRLFLGWDLDQVLNTRLCSHEYVLESIEGSNGATNINCPGASPARTVEKTVTDRRERAQGAALLPVGSFPVGSTQLW